MTRLRVAVIAVAVLGLMGCRERESITGGYGDRVVAGQVAMAAGMLNGSPAGVRVTVAGTGMSAVLDTTGNFMFSSVPENGDLHFTRDDGIDAHFDISASTGPMNILLSATTATSGRRRSASPTPLKQYEGVVEAISATEIKLNGTTLKITADTAIWRGAVKMQTTDIHLGDRVHVKANGDAAVQITLQNGDDSGSKENATMTANGLVTAVSTADSTLKVSTEAHGVVTVKADPTTIIRKQGTLIGLGDIKADDQVNTMGTRVDAQTEQAKQIEVRGVSGHK